MQDIKYFAYFNALVFMVFHTITAVLCSKANFSCLFKRNYNVIYAFMQ